MSRKYEAEVEIAATPEAVWRAISEAEGIQSWFAPEVRVTPGVGGSIWASWGPGMEGESRIEIWEPNQHQRHAHDRPDGREPNVVDYTIQSRDGAHTTLRIVNSGFGADASFDGELESTSHAWPLFLFLLKYGVEHPHRRSRNITVFRMAEISQAEAWKRITAPPAPEGKLLHVDPYGNGCWESPGRLTAVFCEKCGGEKAMLTIMCLLYDPGDGFEAETMTYAESLANKIV